MLLFLVTAMRIIITFLQVGLECVVTISPPCATRDWAVEKKGEVPKFVSVPLLPTAKRFRAHGTLPLIPRGGDDWYGGEGRDGGGWARKGLRLVDKILGVSLLPVVFKKTLYNQLISEGFQAKIKEN